MKDLPHHIKKLNRKVIRSVHRQEAEDATFEAKLPSPPNHPRSELAERKYEKQEMKKERLKHIPIHPSEDEKNHLMKHRTPIFDRTNDALPKHAKPSKKKKPPL